MTKDSSFSLLRRGETRRYRFPAAPLKRIGDFLQRRQDIVRRIQWTCVAIYLLLLVTPVAAPQSVAAAAPFISLAHMVAIIFWVLWWPAVILATLLFGQFWCGLFCPDGTMTEFISRHGRAGKIPLKLRWPGWPLLGFSLITVLWYLFDARRSPWATLALLAGGTLLAWGTGYFLGRGKRVWCRFLCPAGSVFSLLARGALCHFRVDRPAWEAVPRPLPKPVDCAQLLDIRYLRSNEKCSMCGRCSGHRNAVVLAPRWPGQEIAELREDDANPRDAFAISFVLIGLCYGVAYGRADPLGDWLQGALGSGALTGLASVILTATALGGGIAVSLALGAGGHARRALLLSYGLIPLAGIGLFVGALEYARDILKGSGMGALAWVSTLRIPLLLAGSVWTILIGLAMVRRLELALPGRFAAGIGYVMATSLVATCYLLAPYFTQV